MASVVEFDSGDGYRTRLACHFEGDVILEIRQGHGDGAAFASNQGRGENRRTGTGVEEIDLPVYSVSRDGDGHCLPGGDGLDGPVRWLAGGIPEPAKHHGLVSDGRTPDGGRRSGG